MSKKHRPPRKNQGKGRSRPPSAIEVRRARDEEAWELVHPRCAVEREDDIQEVEAMIEAGETDIAVDELRWLLDGCSDFMRAHTLLGMLALGEDNDVQLARGHFGYAYQLGLTALRRKNMPSPLPYHRPANRPLFEAGKGLAYCLKELGKPEMAREVVEQVLACDASDPLGLKEM